MSSFRPFVACKIVRKYTRKLLSAHSSVNNEAKDRCDLYLYPFHFHLFCSFFLYFFSPFAPSIWCRCVLHMKLLVTEPNPTVLPG